MYDFVVTHDDHAARRCDAHAILACDTQALFDHLREVHGGAHEYALERTPGADPVVTIVISVRGAAHAQGVAGLVTPPIADRKQVGRPCEVLTRDRCSQLKPPCWACCMGMHMPMHMHPVTSPDCAAHLARLLHEPRVRVQAFCDVDRLTPALLT